MGHARVVKKTMKPFMAQAFIPQLTDVLADFIGNGAEAWYVRKLTDTDALAAMLELGFNKKATVALTDWLSQLGKLVTWDFLAHQSNLWHTKWSIRHAQLSQTIRSEVELLERQQVWDPILETQVIGDYTITPLCSGLELEKEGLRMHHCVHGVSYMRACLNGTYRIYHVQHKDIRKDCSTLQMVFHKEQLDPLNAWTMGQNQGISNQATPLTEANKIASKQFITQFQVRWAELQAANATAKLQAIAA